MKPNTDTRHSDSKPDTKVIPPVTVWLILILMLAVVMLLTLILILRDTCNHAGKYWTRY